MQIMHKISNNVDRDIFKGSCGFLLDCLACRQSSNSIYHFYLSVIGLYGVATSMFLLFYYIRGNEEKMGKGVVRALCERS